MDATRGIRNSFDLFQRKNFPGLIDPERKKTACLNWPKVRRKRRGVEGRDRNAPTRISRPKNRKRKIVEEKRDGKEKPYGAHAPAKSLVPKKCLDL